MEIKVKVKMKGTELKVIDFFQLYIIDKKRFIIYIKRDFLFNQFKKYLQLMGEIEIIEDGKNPNNLHYIIIENKPYKKFDFDFHIQNFYDYLDTLHI